MCIPTNSSAGTLSKLAWNVCTPNPLGQGGLKYAALQGMEHNRCMLHIG